MATKKRKKTSRRMTPSQLRDLEEQATTTAQPPPESRTRQKKRKQKPEATWDVETMLEAEVVITDPLERFKEEWRRLPPMVRAGEAMAIVLPIAQRSDGDDAQKEFCRKAGLPRREKVVTAFSAARAMIQHLFIGLAREADEEAAKLGINVDVAPSTTKLVSKVWTKGDQKIVIKKRVPIDEKE